jgi:hypothetical protein
VTRRAFLERRHPVDVRDVSRRGCCVEGPSLLPVGAVGVLAVEMDGERHAEVFRVARSGAVPGQDHYYEAGVEFLPMPAGTPSLVEVVAELDACEGLPEREGRRLRDR